MKERQTSQRNAEILWLRLQGNSTFDDSERRVRLIQRNGQTQSLEVLLLMEKVGQLLLPLHTSTTFIE